MQLLNSTNPIFIALIEEIESQLIGIGIDAADLEVSRSNQPTAQHAGATGSTAKYQVFLTTASRGAVVMERTTSGETELTASYKHNNTMTVQIDCLTDYDPADEDSIDANNFIQTIYELLKQFDALSSLRDKGVSIINCGAVRPSYTIMDSGFYESTPSFDLQINYNSQRSKVVPSTNTVSGDIYEV